MKIVVFFLILFFLSRTRSSYLSYDHDMVRRNLASRRALFPSNQTNEQHVRLCRRDIAFFSRSLSCRDLLLVEDEKREVDTELHSGVKEERVRVAVQVFAHITQLRQPQASLFVI